MEIVRTKTKSVETRTSNAALGLVCAAEISPCDVFHADIMTMRIAGEIFGPIERLEWVLGSPWQDLLDSKEFY